MTPHIPQSVNWFPSYSEGQLNTPTLLLEDIHSGSGVTLELGYHLHDRDAKKNFKIAIICQIASLESLMSILVCQSVEKQNP